METNKKYFIKMDELNKYSKPELILENMLTGIDITKINDIPLSDNPVIFHSKDKIKIDGSLVGITDKFKKGNYFFNVKIGTLPRENEKIVYVGDKGNFTFFVKNPDSELEFENSDSRRTAINIRPSKLTPKIRTNIQPFTFKPMLNIPRFNESILLYKINDVVIPQTRQRKHTEQGENLLDPQIFNDEMSILPTDKLTLIFSDITYSPDKDLKEGDFLKFKSGFFKKAERGFGEFELIKKCYLEHYSTSETPEALKKYLVFDVNLQDDLPNIKSGDQLLSINNFHSPKTSALFTISQVRINNIVVEKGKVIFEGDSKPNTPLKVRMINNYGKSLLYEMNTQTNEEGKFKDFFNTNISLSGTAFYLEIFIIGNPNSTDTAISGLYYLK